MILPKPAEGFEWTEAQWGRALRCTHIEQPHVFSTRDLPLRLAGVQQPAAWDHLAVALGVRQGNLLRPRQVHGDVVTVVAEVAGDAEELCSTAADAMMTSRDRKG